MSIVIFEISDVFTRAIYPFKMALTVLFVVKPIAVILDSIRPSVNSLAIDLIVEELSFVDTTIGAS